MPTWISSDVIHKEENRVVDLAHRHLEWDPQDFQVAGYESAVTESGNYFYGFSYMGIP